MRFSIIYISPNGTTRETAKLLKIRFEKENHSVELLDMGSEICRKNPSTIISTIKKSDIVGLGAPAYHMHMISPLKKFLENLDPFEEEVKTKVFLFINYGGITTGKAFIQSVHSLSKAGLRIIGALKIRAPHFHHKNEFPDNDAIASVDEFYQKMESKNFSPISYDQYKKLFSPAKKKVNFIYPFVRIVGKKRELPIDIDLLKCQKCKKCVKECPAGAMEIESNCTFIDFKKCLHCYHCVVTCPFGAVKSPINKLDSMIRINKKILGMEKPLNEVFV